MPIGSTDHGISNLGYVYIRVPKEERANHPTIRPDGYIHRSHYVWNTAHPDDPVIRGEIIHHRNHVKTDDQIENLRKWHQSEHASYHTLGKKRTEEASENMRRAQQERRRREREAAV